MRKLKISTLVTFLLAAFTLSAQDGGRPVAGAPSTSGEKKGWPSTERYNFIRECIGTAKANLSENAARYYCYCMQERIEIKYPSIEEAGARIDAEMNTPSFKKDVKECKVSGWDDKSQTDFMSECTNTATGSLGEEKTRTYCECMLFKIQKVFPDPSVGEKVISEALKTPEWKKIAQGCMDF